MANEIKFTIITATFNSENTLPRLIESLKHQSDADFEWVVSDGGSSDNTLNIINAEKASMRKVVIDSRPDKGVYDALNKGIHLSSGDYYLVVGSDDILDIDAVKNYKKSIYKTRADIISAQVICNGQKIKNARPKWLWRHGAAALISSHSVGTVINKRLHEKIGYYNTKLRIYSDSHFILKSKINGCTFYQTPIVAGIFSTDGLSNKDLLSAYTEQFIVQMNTGSNFFIQLIMLFLRLIFNRRSIIENTKEKLGSK